MAVLEVQPISWQERRKRQNNLIDELGLGHLRHNMGYALSGGERRRVEIARALCIAPKFILLDEPFSGIDPIAVLDLQKIIFDLKANGIGVLVTDHNVRETLSVTDRAYIINEGRKDFTIQRYKGLGEMTAPQLWETTMDPERRTLLSVKLEDIAECETIFTTLMGEDVEARRKFIEENALDVKNLDI